MSAIRRGLPATNETNGTLVQCLPGLTGWNAIEDTHMAKVKLDLQQIKAKLLEKGERFGLGVAAVIMVLFLFLGVLSALRSSSPDKDILQAANTLKSRIQRGSITDEEIQKLTAPEPPEWYALLDPDRWEGRSIFQAAQGNDTKRHNPFIMPIGRVVKDQVTDVQMNVVRGDFLAYQMYPETLKVAIFGKGAAANPAGGGAAGAFVPAGSGPFGGGMPGFGGGKSDDAMVHLVQARRVVVVSSVFPYAQQVELFRKALRVESIGDLIKERLIPDIRGLNVVRTEVLPGGKFAPWQQIYTSDSGGRAVLSDKAAATKKVFQECVYDESQVEQLAKYVVPGLVTPAPRLAYGSYPPLKLGELTTKEQLAKAAPEGKGPAPMAGSGSKGVGPVMPGAKMPGVGSKGAGGNPAQAQERPTSTVEYKELPSPQRQAFARRFKDKLVLFSPDGLPGGQKSANGAFPYFMMNNPQSADKQKKDAKDDDIDDTPPNQAGTDNKNPMGIPGGAASASISVPDKVLARFIDADVEPGKTYIYAVQVRVKNPNFKQPEVTAFKGLAEIEELLSPWTVTAPVTVPAEWDYYAVDQFVLDPEAKKHPAKGADTKVKDQREWVAVQLHKWVDRFFDRRNQKDEDLGDWSVLQRLLLRRGEPVARLKVAVELPEWAPNQDSFLLVGRGPKEQGKKAASETTLDYVPPASEPDLVVDFQGGMNVDYTVAGHYIGRENAAVELLVLTPDGKLLLRDGHVDADPDSPRGQARAQHYLRWQDRLDALKGYGLRPTTTRPAGKN
jgi:hypothetical protein